MHKEELLQECPTKRIKPHDGMAVTAAVWEEAHEYHRQHLRSHVLFNHGPGIVTGLEVIASDPPDSSVYILPGIAIDPEGQTIMLTQPVAYDFGQESEGLLYLLLSYGESRPTAGGGEGQKDGLLYVHAEFAMHAQPTLPDTPHVELARVRRQGKGAAIQDAQDAAHPGPNELDQRFRQEIGAVPQKMDSLAVIYLGGDSDKRHGRGANYLARALGRSVNVRVWVDENVPIADGLEAYTLVYLVGQGAFQLSREEMDSIYAYLQGGGTVFIESCRREMTNGDPPADASFSELLATLGIKLEDLKAGHSLLVEPFLLAAPPPGFETQGTPSVSVGDGVIFDTHDYGCLWQGERREGTPSREEIRSALEWGGNIVAYAMKRRQKAHDK
jgi:hypothetical protein